MMLTALCYYMAGFIGGALLAVPFSIWHHSSHILTTALTDC